MKPASFRGTAIGEGDDFRFLPVLEAGDIDHLQLKDLYGYWRRECQGRRLPARPDIRDHLIARHVPFLTTVKILQSDGKFRVASMGGEAGRFWRLQGARRDLAVRVGLMRALVRHQAANRLPITLRSVLPGTGTRLGFALLALPLAEDGVEPDHSLVEVVAWDLAA